VNENYQPAHTTEIKNDSAGKNLNFRIACRLEEVAQILESQGGNPFRVQAYRHAAETLRGLSRPAEEILRQEGEPGLRKLPGIGERLARAIATLLITEDCRCWTGCEGKRIRPCCSPLYRESASG